MFKQQWHNLAFQKWTPVIYHIALEADSKIFLDSNCLISTGKLFQAEGKDTKGNLLRYFRSDSGYKIINSIQSFEKKVKNNPGKT